MPPLSSASRSADTNTPVPPIWVSAAVDRSPVVTISTASALIPRPASAAMTVPVWLRASALPRVPIRSGGSVRTASVAPRSRCEPSRSVMTAASLVREYGRGDRSGCGRVEIEQLTQRIGVGAPARTLRQLLDPYGRRVQQGLHDPVHGAGDLGTGALVQPRQPGVQPGQLGVDQLARPRPQRGHRRGARGGPAGAEPAGDLLADD